MFITQDVVWNETRLEIMVKIPEWDGLALVNETTSVHITRMQDEALTPSLF
jgi:hypothetical protein